MTDHPTAVLLRMLMTMLVALALSDCARHPAAHAAAAPVAGCLPTHDGYLRARLRGARNLDIDWRNNDLQCDGGPRPDGHGIRLAFAGPPQADGHRLRFVFGIGGQASGDSAGALPANVTIIFEGESKLYSTRGEDKCTIDQLTRSPLTTHTLRVVGRGFCIAPVAAVDGGDALLLSRFDFAGTMIDTE
ncbi:MAG TPA: hypothetical protein VGH84_03790 [Steroidobacteraceae bacterium]